MKQKCTFLSCLAAKERFNSVAWFADCKLLLFCDWIGAMAPIVGSGGGGGGGTGAGPQPGLPFPDCPIPNRPVGMGGGGGGVFPLFAELTLKKNY